MQLLRDLPAVLHEGALHAARLDVDALLQWGRTEKGWMHTAVALSVVLVALQMLPRGSDEK